MISRISAYARLYIVFVAVLITDQLTKLWIIKTVEPGSYFPPAITLIDGFLYIVHIYNEGAAWGMFSGFGFYLGLLGIVAIITIFVTRKTFELQLHSRQLIFGALIGGILGNVIDRMLHGHVIDFIDVHLPGYRWPAFNIADSAIFIGVAFYIISEMRKKGDYKDDANA